ncbi:CPBP family intramembrane glutamic endopeptidase [Marinicauda algicola]|nr:CPBP family intramembrane glutamic endopeptidase [Marinicauda algicola]
MSGDRVFAELAAGPFSSALLLVVLTPALFNAVLWLGASLLSLIAGTDLWSGAVFPAMAAALVVSTLATVAIGLMILHRRGEDLGDVGWSGEASPGFFLYQAMVAAVTVAALALYSVLVFTPTVTLATGSAPVFKAHFDLETMSASGHVVISIMAVAPLFGNSVFRGYALPRLASRAGLAGAIAISSGCYALSHAVLGLQAVLFTFFIGVILSVIFMTVARQRLWGLVAGHCLFNALIPILG